MPCQLIWRVCFEGNAGKAKDTSVSRRPLQYEDLAILPQLINADVQPRERATIQDDADSYRLRSVDEIWDQAAMVHVVQREKLICLVNPPIVPDILYCTTYQRVLLCMWQNRTVRWMRGEMRGHRRRCLEPLPSNEFPQRRSPCPKGPPERLGSGIPQGDPCARRDRL